MLTKQLQNGLIIRSVFLVAFLAIVFFCYRFIDNYKNETLSDNTNIKNEVSSLKRKLQSLNQKNVEFAEAVVTWENFSEKQKQLQGLRINDAKDIIDELQIKYNLTTKVTFSKPEESKNNKLSSESAKIITSTVAIEIDGLTDSHIIAFLEEMEKRIPGYIIINSFRINKLESITKEILRSISIGDPVKVVKGNVSFTWYDFKKTEAEQSR